MARYRFFFWLDGNKDDELLLAEEIDDLKRQRLFTKTIRDGIRLIIDLRRGNLDVLLELFPDLRHKLKTESNGSGGAGDDDLHRRIRMLETAFLQQANIPAVTRSDAARAKVMDAPALLPSAFVSEAAPQTDPTEARANFASSMGNLFDDDDDVFAD